MTMFSKCANVLLGLGLALQMPLGSPAIRAEDADHTRPTPLIRDIEVGYLLNCTFVTPKPHFWTGGTLLSGWETDASGGTWDYHPHVSGPDGETFHIDWFKLIDTSPTAPVTIKHKIARQTEGQITLEYRFKMPVKMDGVAWQLRDLQEPGVSIVTVDGNLCRENAEGEPMVLQSYDAGREYGVKVVADIPGKTADIYVDGDLKAKAAAFCRPIRTIDYVLIKTGPAATGELFLTPVNLYKGYAVCETFVTGKTGKLPADWTADPVGGSVAVEEFECGAKPDIFSLKLSAANDRAVVTGKSFAPVRGKIVFEYRFLVPKQCDGAIGELVGGEKAGIRIVTRGGNLCYASGAEEPIPLVRHYRPNLWYTVKVIADPATAAADIFVNGKLAAARAAFHRRVKTFDALRFAAAPSAVLWVDDVRVYPRQDYPADYVAEPKPCPAKSPYLLGVQSCNLWLEGNSYAGWDYIYPFASERKPYLGWYDEGNPEETDWEIKWQVEHGIGFEVHCWYRPNNAVNHPIKDGVMDQGILQGLFNARYSHLTKFAIMYTNWGAGLTNREDFRQYIIPYWIEYFFKDPRYLKIDNKPVLSIYCPDNLKRMFGGTEGARKAIEVLREESRKAGFPGVIVLMEHGGHGMRGQKCLPCLETIKSMGADYVYAYNWGLEPYVDVQKRDNQVQRDLAATSGIHMLPSISMGAEISAWAGRTDARYIWISVKDYKRLAQWVKEEFMPTVPADSLGRRIVMLGNWNEFGEGNVLMPSTLAGFGYLDALREVFTEGGPHTDAIPTDQQKRRFNVLYPKD